MAKAKDAKEGAGKGRRLEEEGVRLVVACFPEMRDWWNRYCTARAYQRERAGELVSGGEKKGAGASLARAICWLSTLSDADLERIDREGGALLAGLAKLPAGYGQVPGRADPLLIARRAATALVVADRPPVVLKPLGLNRRGAGDHPLGQDVAAEGDDEPAGRP